MSCTDATQPSSLTFGTPSRRYPVIHSSLEHQPQCIQYHSAPWGPRPTFPYDPLCPQ
ncbi:hypothetical protein DPMN_165542 [Dreissena polymorpha]|uniref:Uncharacterized protein n=1 Tax=Dreissena polymorpha TaxID=45954 RepID=A0A9D4EX15_DREPO|nr:hypothetical protein DPMN_165542 [Dreissena polymorpha]